MIVAFVALALLLCMTDRETGYIPTLIWCSMLAASVWPKQSVLAFLNYFAGSKWLVYLGERSYSVYVVHMLPLYVGVYFLNRYELSSGTYAIILVAYCLITTFLLSIFAHAIIERPGILLGSRLAKSLAVRQESRKQLNEPTGSSLLRLEFNELQKARPDIFSCAQARNSRMAPPVVRSSTFSTVLLLYVADTLRAEFACRDRQ